MTSSSRALAAGALAFAAVLLTACSSADTTVTARGLITVEESCAQGTTDYPDIGPGTQVTVADSAHKIIGTSSLGAARARQLAAGTGSFGQVCSYPFTVKVPAGLARYGITVSQRGTVYFTAGQMTRGPWLTMAAPSPF